MEIKEPGSPIIPGNLPQSTPTRRSTKRTPGNTKKTDNIAQTKLTPPFEPRHSSPKISS